jgi:hypothetical protein
MAPKVLGKNKRGEVPPWKGKDFKVGKWAKPEWYLTFKDIRSTMGRESGPSCF